jgi:hypothetical protein
MTWKGNGSDSRVESVIESGCDENKSANIGWSIRKLR